MDVVGRARLNKLAAFEVQFTYREDAFAVSDEIRDQVSECEEG